MTDTYIEAIELTAAELDAVSGGDRGRRGFSISVHLSDSFNGNFSGNNATAIAGSFNGNENGNTFG